MAIKMNVDEMDKIISDFSKGKELKAEIYVEFDNINNVDTLILLRAMGKEPDPNEIAAIAELMLDGHSISFKRGEEVIVSCNYNKGSGGKLHLMPLFQDNPCYYDILQQAVYCLLLKKLTPHLDGSN